MTKRAIRQLQSENGLELTGVADTNTVQAVQDAADNKED